MLITFKRKPQFYFNKTSYAQMALCGWGIDRRPLETEVIIMFSS
jgi:hypothetical protein